MQQSSAVGAPTSENDAPTAFRLSPDARRVFIGLILGMLVASVSQTIVGPAMPRIVAELGGMEHYSWVATAAMLVSAITVPIVGKLSDLYGRRAFYLGGLVVFMIGSLVSGLAPNFWTLVVGRAIQGIGMGALMPLSQTIIGDIVPARQRGKYQGLMGAVFGVTSVAGPLAGGFITDHFGWRWLFFAPIALGLAVVLVIWRFLHLDQQRRDAKVDSWGIATLSIALVAILLATSWGGTTYPWGSGQILGLYAIGAVFLVAFVAVERRAEEPVIPLGLFRSSVFTWSNIAAFGVAMVMFGAIIYIPVYAQGVLGVGATESGLILMPLMVALVFCGVLAGLLVTKTGRYKELMLTGVLVMGLGIWLLTRLSVDSSSLDLTIGMAVLGIGLGMTMQQYTLVVQNASTRRDLGVATASTQFFRNVGSTVGIAIFGTVMTSGLHEAIASHLPPEVAARMPADQASAGAVLDPSALSQMPPVVANAVREGLADRLHDVFLLGLPIVAGVFFATLAIKALPLRETIHSNDDAGRELLDTLGQSSHDQHELVPGFSQGEVGHRTRERVLGLTLASLADEAQREDRPYLRRAVSDLGDGDLDVGVELLRRTSTMLTSEDARAAADAERYAAEVAARAARHGGLLSHDLRKDLAVAAAESDRRTVLSVVEPSVADRHEAVDVRSLFAASSDLSAAYVVDVAEARAEQARRR